MVESLGEQLVTGGHQEPPPQAMSAKRLLGVRQTVEHDEGVMEHGWCLAKRGSGAMLS
jgi:hypothetical protein